MAKKTEQLQRLVLVYGNVPTTEEIDQIALLRDEYRILVVSSESICGYIAQTCRVDGLECAALPDYDENTTYLPGLEQILDKDDIVIVKERLGIYAYQALKAKWRLRFRLLFWVDNLTPFPAQDIHQLRTIRDETAQCADGFIVQSDAALQALLLEGIESSRIHKFNPWVPALDKVTKKDKADSMAKLNLSDGDFVIGYMGQVEWEEGLLDLVHGAKLAMGQSGSLNRRLKLAFYGIGSFSEQINEILTTYNMDRRCVYVAPSREAFDAFVRSIDCIFVGPNPGRDRIEGDPYRIMHAMAKEIPVLGCRNPIVEEFIGKHRIDYCQSSFAGLCTAILKAEEAGSLVNNIVSKNKTEYEKRYGKEKMLKGLRKIISGRVDSTIATEIKDFEKMTAEVEAKVQAKQYIAAIDLVEGLFKRSDLPSHHRANLYRLVGDSFTKLGDGESGKKAYLEAANLDPYSSKAYIGLGTVGLMQNGFDISIVHFQKAVSLAPQDEMANFGLGLAFQGLNELKEAEKWVEKSLDINPYNTAAIFTRVKIAYGLEDYKGAIHSIRVYLEKHPKDFNMIFSLAGLLFKVGELNEVSALASTILEADPFNQRAQALAKQVEEIMSGKSSVATKSG